MTTTEVAPLPGLEAPATQAQPKPQNWLERGPSKRLMLVSGRSHPDLAEDIGAKLGVTCSPVELKTFANGEVYCRYEESVRGADLFIVQSCAGVGKVNAYLWELLEMINAAKLASAKRVTAVMPWFPYSRQDKKSAPREPISARLLADTLEKAAGADRVLTMDLHTGQIQGFFTIPVDHMTALPLFAQYFRDKGLSGERVVSVSPDAGRAKLARRFGQMLEGDLAIMNKTRPAHDQASITEVIGDVEGKTALMGDDMILTGGTLLAGAKALREAGAKEVYVFATHGHFVGDALEKLATDDLAEIVVTDTVPLNPLERPDMLTVLPVSGLLADTIMNVFADESVSAVFQGANQLF
ncbi:MAG TPA: ribose-phosphate pyrophosphokinase [Gaiellaceae bacterium]|nr:ribose-phosphate pyrophosphokinase [Gaiellaceae bacterium]